MTIYDGSLQTYGAPRIHAELAAVALALNSRPRKTLGWRTPAERLNDHLLTCSTSGLPSP